VDFPPFLLSLFLKNDLPFQMVADPVYLLILHNCFPLSKGASLSPFSLSFSLFFFGRPPGVGCFGTLYKLEDKVCGQSSFLTIFGYPGNLLFFPVLLEMPFLIFPPLYPIRRLSLALPTICGGSCPLPPSPTSIRGTSFVIPFFFSSKNCKFALLSPLLAVPVFPY